MKTEVLSSDNTLIGIGECMVELSPMGDGLMRQSFAGDVLNTLWYARAALGPSWSTRFVSAVGTDPLSQNMLDFIEAGGIDCGLVRRIPDRRPGLYTIHLDHGERSFHYWRDQSAARLLAADRPHLTNAVFGADVIYLSGITLAILPREDAQFLLDRLKTATASGKTVFFDSNIRPSLWSDAAWMREAIHLAAAHSSIVLPSFDDEQMAFEDASPKETLQRYADMGANIVILKNGDSDILALEDGEVQVFETDAVTEPVDTTGAGDSFNGAFIADYLTSGDIENAVKAGQACSAQVVRHHGALIGKPTEAWLH